MQEWQGVGWTGGPRDKARTRCAATRLPRGSGAEHAAQTGPAVPRLAETPLRCELVGARDIDAARALTFTLIKLDWLWAHASGLHLSSARTGLQLQLPPHVRLANVLILNRALLRSLLHSRNSSQSATAMLLYVLAKIKSEQTSALHT